MDCLHRCLRDVLVADARCVDKGFVRQIHQVVDEQPVIAFGEHGLAIAFPFGIVVPMHVGYQRRVGQRRIARPDPDKAIAFDNRIGPHARGRIQLVLGRHARALAGAVEGKAVIAANEFVAVEPAHRKRQGPMPAGIFQRGHGTVRIPPEHHGDVACGPRESFLPSDLVAPGCGIPCV